MKKEIFSLDATPTKRTFLSIISDYDINKSICELIDNGIDAWIRKDKSKELIIKIDLDMAQQTIIVEDNAGGLAKSELRYIVGPGQSGTNPNEETIGIFGVGSKRAVVALSQDIRIKTRYCKEKTYEVDFDDNWLKDDSWELAVYAIDEISEGTTIVELQKLRIHIDDDLVTHLKDHLRPTYGKFLLNDNISIIINNEKIVPLFFENWAYPPDYLPQKYTGSLTTEDGNIIHVEALAGLSQESSPSAGEYGVYFYCNDRLIARALRSFEVGFASGLAGLPHPKVSLTRVIVYLNGSATSMPWNSSKSDINPNHEVFKALQNWLILVVKENASLSRIWMGQWPEKVFKYKEGKFLEVQIDDFPKVKKSFLPPLPASRPRYSEIIIRNNKEIGLQKPWSKGLYEGIIFVDIICKQNLEQKNRIALIVLDSTLEIAFKEYLVNESGANYNDEKLITIFKNRNTVQSEINKYVKIKSDLWRKIDYYYRLRCKLVHERITVGIHEDDINDFRNIVEEMLNKLFELNF